MNSLLKYSVRQSHLIERPVTYTYLMSLRQMSFFQSRVPLMALGLEKNRRLTQISVQGTACVIIKDNASSVRHSVLNISPGRQYSSSIFVSDRDKNLSSSFCFDLDIEDKLADTEQLKTNLEKRGISIDIDQLRRDYHEYMEIDRERRKLENKREDIAKQIANIVAKQKENKTKSDELVSEMKILTVKGKEAKNSLKELMVKYWDIEEKVMLTALSLPNHLSFDVPKEEKVLEEYFQERRPEVQVDHYKLLMESGMVRLSNVGNKAYYLKGRLAMLEQELTTHFSKELRSNNVIQMLAPEMFKTPVVEGIGLDVLDPASVYRLQYKQGTEPLTDWDTDNFFLKGASQLSFLSYFARMTIKSKDLPLRMFVVGTHYQPENSNTEKLPGLFGVLQSRKVCMCGLCITKESSLEIKDQFVSLLADIYKQFELPFRLVSLPALSLTAAEQNRIELQMWVPSQQNYLKVASVSMYGEYNSRRLMIRSSDDTHKTRPVEMVHCEVTDITRMLAILLEYGQTDRHLGR